MDGSTIFALIALGVLLFLLGAATNDMVTRKLGHEQQYDVPADAQAKITELRQVVMQHFNLNEHLINELGKKEMQYAELMEKFQASEDTKAAAEHELHILKSDHAKLKQAYGEVTSALRRMETG